MPVNHRITLAERPVNRPVQPTDFRLEEAPIPVPATGEVLLRTLYLSLDPYMRGRMSEAKSYAQPVQIGEVMIGETVSEVVASNDPTFVPGDTVLGRTGWQEYAALPAKGLIKVDGKAAPLSYYLGVLGMPGMTGYFALLDIGQPKPGETVLVSAAAGAVGQVVGQIAKLKGCRVIGIAGGADKCAYVTKDLGFDAAIDYRGKDATALSAEIAALAPNGVDVYFDNVGGAIHDAAMMNVALRARIIICGAVAIYDKLETQDTGARWMRTILAKRARMEGFLVFDYDPRRAEFLADMSAWLRGGLVHYREDVTEGLARAPEAFIGMLAGKNLGKQLIHVADPSGS
ncbi:NADP-dependent oxidoreductase [Aliidongia dinghuensis]|uniref:NADP-dependent oxidoreductase n=1 Tax=Aliidongia dinghuensis TaxID=1867774 RepID=A0A8J2YY40_9PROT|nr:NADP-dependent oxidoreductase [Aliidongia dinghuensis]GGF35001.1 NADP-dependent oxidoreductase [Aliidongia dinghuensis]